MRRSLILIAALPIVLAVPGEALGQAGPGHNKQTRKLEAAFKVAQFERAHSADGCYPPPAEMADKLRKANIRAGVSKGTGGVNRAGIVYVIRSRTRCEQIFMALRSGGLWTLDSDKGTVEQAGRGGGKRNIRDAVIGGRGPLRALKFKTKEIRLNKADEAVRAEVGCPGGTFPLGGGMIASPPVAADGEGVYPHSYERLGAQRGWHINPVLFDPKVIADPQSPGTKAHDVTLQVVCGKGLVAFSGPRKTIFLRPGESGSVTARCPGGQTLIAGGFQRTNFRSVGGDYVTESRALDPRTWRVSGAAFGIAGGELTSIAYCDRNKKPLLREVSAAGSVAAGQPASVTTPSCPSRWRLTSGGFSFNGSTGALFAGGSLNSNGTWTANAYGFFGPAPSFTAHGYCLKPGRG